MNVNTTHMITHGRAEARAAGTPPSQALVYIRNNKIRRMAQRLLFSAGFEIQSTSSLVPLATQPRGRCHVLLYFVEDMEQWEKERALLDQIIAGNPGILVFYLLMTPDRKVIADVLANPGFANIHSPLDVEDLFISLRKAFSGDIFGIEKYLSWGSLTKTFQLINSRQKDGLIEELRDFTARLCGNSHIAERVATVSDELVMNSFFNAPVDAQGQHRYRHLDRSHTVTLEPHETVEFSYGSNGRVLALGCRDPFGSITSETIVNQLGRCFMTPLAEISHETGGAGLGLYIAYNYAAKMVVNLHRGHQTEFIALFDMEISLRELQLRTRSLNIFEAPNGGPAPRARQAAPPAGGAPR